MSFLDTLKKFTQPYADEDEYFDDDMDGFDEPAAEEPAATRRPSPFASSRPSADSGFQSAPAQAPGFSGQVLNMGNSGKQEVFLFHAKTFEDAAKAADELRKKKAVIVNMENVDKGQTRRIVDFLSGSVYALDGSVKKVAQSTYLFCPHNMDIVGDLESQIDMESFT